MTADALTLARRAARVSCHKFPRRCPARLYQSTSTATIPALHPPHPFPAIVRAATHNSPAIRNLCAPWARTWEPVRTGRAAFAALEAMPLTLRSLSRTVPVGVNTWTETVSRRSLPSLVGAAQVGFRRGVRAGRVSAMADTSAEKKLSGAGTLKSLASVRTNFALKAADGEAVMRVDHEEVVEASEEFRQRALVSSRAQVRLRIGWHGIV